MSGTTRRGPRGVRVLLADRATQGLRADDRSGCVDGEICWILPACSNDAAGCRCWQEFEGASTRGRTTTVRVGRMRAADRGDLLRAIRDAATPSLGPVLAARVAAHTLAVAASYPEGFFLERDRRGVRSQFCGRHQAHAAAALARIRRDGAGR